MVTENGQTRMGNVKQLSFQITDETARQIAELAKQWGLRGKRYNTPVIERCIERVYQQEIAKRERERKQETTD